MAPRGKLVMTWLLQVETAVRFAAVVLVDDPAMKAKAPLGEKAMDCPGPVSGIGPCMACRAE